MIAIWDGTHDANPVHSLLNTRSNITPSLWVQNWLCWWTLNSFNRDLTSQLKHNVEVPWAYLTFPYHTDFNFFWITFFFLCISSFIQNSFITQLNFAILPLHYFKVLWVYLSIFNQAHLKCLNKCVASVNVQPHTKHRLYTANVWGFTLNTLSKPKQPWPLLLEMPELTSTSMDVKQKINFILQLVLADSSFWSTTLRCLKIEIFI